MDLFNDLLRGFIQFRGFNGRRPYPNEPNEGDINDRDFGVFGRPPYPVPPGQRDFEDFWRESDDQGSRGPPPPNRSQGQFVFGDMFSMMGELFQEMERSMRDMENFFGGQDNSFPGRGPPMLPAPDQNEPKSSNPRDQMLKKVYIRPPTSAADKIDRDMDDLFKSGQTLGSLDLPIANPDEEVKTITPLPRPNISPDAGHGRGSYIFSFSQYNNTNGVVQGKEIRETNQGREVTTYKQNERGEIEKETEFFPSSSTDYSPGTNLPILKDDDRDSVPSFFSKLFRPRM